LAFKASVAPFHQWTPDVYEGAPTPITAFMAVATKVAALSVLLRLFDVALIEAHGSWGPALATLATITILVGNVGALGQSSLKRMLAYSSVAQAGYMLAGVVVATQLGAQATVLYLAVYLAMNMAAFAVIVARERETGLGDNVQALAGLGRERPWLAWPMTIAMLALAGIPATAGFVGKFYLIDAAVSGGYTWLGVVIVVGSMISLGYYLPVIATIWMGSAPATVATPPPGAIPAIAGGSPELDDDPGDGAPDPGAGTPLPAAGDDVPIASSRTLPAASGDVPVASSRMRQPEVTFVAVLAGAATLVFGIFPQPLFDLVHGVGSALGLL
jgi:NADH-quinone oxidoreductase subunit N